MVRRWRGVGVCGGERGGWGEVGLEDPGGGGGGGRGQEVRGWRFGRREFMTFP